MDFLPVIPILLTIFQISSERNRHEGRKKSQVWDRYFSDRDKLLSAKFEADKKFEEEYSSNAKEIYESFVKKL